jgi:hypothetical protein
MQSRTSGPDETIVVPESPAAAEAKQSIEAEFDLDGSITRAGAGASVEAECWKSAGTDRLGNWPKRKA